MFAFRLPKAREHNAPSLIVLGPLIVTEDVGHEALWLAVVNEVRQPIAHADLFSDGLGKNVHRVHSSILVSEVWALVNGPSSGGPRPSTDGQGRPRMDRIQRAVYGRPVVVFGLPLMTTSARTVVDVPVVVQRQVSMVFTVQRTKFHRCRSWRFPLLFNDLGLDCAEARGVSTGSAVAVHQQIRRHPCRFCPTADAHGPDCGDSTGAFLG